MRSMTQLNAVGAEMRSVPGVHAMTDVTGIRPAGALARNVPRARRWAPKSSLKLCPCSPTPSAWRRQESAPAAPSGIGKATDMRSICPSDAPEWWRGVLCDPQTSGGLLIACSSESVPQVLELLVGGYFDRASVVGEFRNTQPRVRVS